MDLKKIALTAVAGIALLGTAPAFANPPYWAPAHGWRAQHHHYYHRAPAYVVYQPQPYYVPPPVVYSPPVYYQPRPVIYGTLPVGDARVRFGVRF